MSIDGLKFWQALGSSTPFSNFFYGSGNNNTARTKLSPEEEKFWDEMGMDNPYK